MGYPKHGEILKMNEAERVEYLDALEVEQRLEQMAKLPEGERDRLIEGLPTEQRMKWINEEREHLESLAEPMPVEGADFGEDPKEQVQVPGSEAPQDRAPDVGAELVATLVKERIDAEQRANVAESKVARYRAKYGELA